MARPARAYILVSALALAGMVARMGWVHQTHLYGAVFILCLILGVGLLLGMIAAVTWVFVSIVRLIFGRGGASQNQLHDDAGQPR